MAKNKDDDFESDEEEIEEGDADEEESDIEEPAADEEEEPEAADEEEAAVDEEEEPADDEVEPQPRRRAKLSWLTIILIFLNWIAAGAFVYLLFLDYRVRQDWSYAVFRNYLTLEGLPLEDEEQSPGFHTALPRLRLDPEQLKDEAGKRGVKASPAFVAVDEPIRFQVLPGHLSEEVVKDIGLEKDIKTLNDEIKRLRGAVPNDIKKAADAAAANLKSDDDKARAIEAALLPLAWDVYQIEKLHLRVTGAKGPELDDLVSEAYQRRIYADILIPLNLFRPGDADKLMVEKLADLDAYRVENLKALLEKRIDGASAAKYDPEINYGVLWQGASDRDSIEKRQQIAFLLFTLSQARAPDRVTRIYPKGLERAQTVSGLYEFAMAAQHYLQTIRAQEAKIIEAIKNDREGHLATIKGQPSRTAGFAERYGTEVTRLLSVVADIEHAQKRIEDLQAQHKRFEAVLTDRNNHMEMISKKIVTARQDTANALTEVRKLQRELYYAQKTLADAADRNFKLERDIRAWESKVREGR